MTYKRWQGPTRPVSNGATVERLRLEVDEDAPRHARAALARLVGQADTDVLSRATLLTSEVVTNAVEHAGGTEIRVDIWPAGGSVAVVVCDDGPGFVAVPESDPVAGRTRGFGLPLVDTLSEAWGSGHDDEAWVWFEVSPRIIARPEPVLAAGTAADHDDLLDVRMVMDSVRKHALVALDETGRVTSWGAGARELTGYSDEQMLGRSLSELYVPTSLAGFEKERAKAAAQGSQQGTHWIRLEDGSQFWSEVSLAAIVDHSGKRRGLSALISDITERKRIEDAREYLISDLRDLAMTDDLTGLPNRRRWSEELNRDLARARRYGTPLAIAMLDLNGFKAFNDSYGHPAGDGLLRTVARSWSEGLRAADMLARYGGDEFSMTLPDCTRELALTVIERVRAATPEGISAAVGLATSDGTTSAEALVARADAALYEAKRDRLPVVVAQDPDADKRRS